MNQINFIIIKATKDYPFLRLRKNDHIKLINDGKFLRCGSHTWSERRIFKEIHLGYWNIIDMELDKKV